MLFTAAGRNPGATIWSEYSRLRAKAEMTTATNKQQLISIYSDASNDPKSKVSAHY
jgi:hypothetical protein